MKTNIGILLFILSVTCFANTSAQECSDVLFMKKGALLTYTDYSKKGKELSSTVHETISVTQENEEHHAVIKATKKDKKGKETFATNFNTRCNGGLFSVDMMRFMDYDKLSEQQKEGVALEIDGDVLEFPVNSNVGDELDDGHINLKLNSQGFTLVTMTFDIKNRKIIGEENITTPAGTFACQKITFDFESKFGFIKVKGSGIEWYHDNVVVIKSESYNKKGNLTGYHQLTGIQ
ncbi:TapB family protein [Aquimarina sediminis]|uniref:TapB family protein n=1 Tax=Aquimarina sediminis TaxID=2070536 RepID=UPI000CA03C85|nr:hypothetical protein [Aquimarina sediminis]